MKEIRPSQIFKFNVLGFLLTTGFLFAGCAGDEPIVGESRTSSKEGGVQKETVMAQTPQLNFEPIELSNLSRIDKAYRVIGKERKKFDPTNASIKPSHREYLTEVLALIDQAVLWRVSGMQSIARGTGERKKWLRGADNLLAGLRQLEPPRGWEKHQKMLQESLLAYRAFFHRCGGYQVKLKKSTLINDGDIRKASELARQAYNFAISKSKRIDRDTQAAIYHSHMALDPI
ncbi:MAG: hypothetical protein AAGA30_03580 [Planctomycetota bacterium]